MKLTLTSVVLNLKTFSWLLHFYFLQSKIHQCFYCFRINFHDFCFKFELDRLLQGFLIGKFEKVNRVWALISIPSNNFLTKVSLWYRACLQRPTYGISVFLASSIHGPRTFFLSRMPGRWAFLTRSCYGFYLWQGCALVSYPWGGKNGPYFSGKLPLPPLFFLSAKISTWSHTSLRADNELSAFNCSSWECIILLKMRKISRLKCWPNFFLLTFGEINWQFQMLFSYISLTICEKR